MNRLMAVCFSNVSFSIQQLAWHHLLRDFQKYSLLIFFNRSCLYSISTKQVIGHRINTRCVCNCFDGSNEVYSSFLFDVVYSMHSFGPTIGSIFFPISFRESINLQIIIIMGNLLLPQDAERHVLLLGLEKAGKTHMLYTRLVGEGGMHTTTKNLGATLGYNYE